MWVSTPSAVDDSQRDASATVVGQGQGSMNVETAVVPVAPSEAPAGEEKEAGEDKEASPQLSLEVEIGSRATAVGEALPEVSAVGDSIPESLPSASQPKN